MNVEHENVAVVVVTYNSASVIAGLLASLDAGFEGVPYHLVVVDNASSDGVVELVRELAPDALVVETGRNAGYAGGINAGVAAAGPHTAIMVLNPDVRLHRGCVATLLATLREPNTGIAVPRLSDGNGELIASQRREPTVLRVLASAVLGARRAGRFGALGEVVTAPDRYEASAVVDWAEGSTLLISAECWARVGPWDESYFLFSEETDFALRARDVGLATRYTPLASAIHMEGGSSTSISQWPLLVLNSVRLFRRRHHLAHSAAFWFAVLARESSRALLGKATSRRAMLALLSPAKLRERPGPHSVRP